MSDAALFGTLTDSCRRHNGSWRSAARTICCSVRRCLEAARFGILTIRLPDGRAADRGDAERGAGHMASYRSVALGAILRAGLTRKRCTVRLRDGGSGSRERVESIFNPL
jgi:hypothetical protein